MSGSAPGGGGGSWLEIRLPNAPSQEDAQGCSMVYGRKTKKGRQGGRKEKHSPPGGGEGMSGARVQEAQRTRPQRARGTGGLQERADGRALLVSMCAGEMLYFSVEDWWPIDDRDPKTNRQGRKGHHRQLRKAQKLPKTGNKCIPFTGFAT